MAFNTAWQHISCGPAAAATHNSEEASMNICAFMGSPHAKGNTATLLEQVLAGARSAGHATERVDLYPLTIGPCLGCMGCKAPSSKGCVQHDDMQALYPKVQQADIMIWATPMYWWNVSGPLKNCIDRLFALPFDAAHKALKGKRLLLVMTSGQQPETDGRDGLELMLKHTCDFTEMTYAGVVTAGSGTTPVADQPDVLAAAFARGANL